MSINDLPENTALAIDLAVDTMDLWADICEAFGLLPTDRVLSLPRYLNTLQREGPAILKRLERKAEQ